MILLQEYNLNLDLEWNNYINFFDEYIKEISKEEGFEYFDSKVDFDYKKNILKVVNRPVNKFHIYKIIKDQEQIGFVDYVCWLDEDGKSLIGNLYINEEERNKGYGSKVLYLVEQALREIGAKYIDVTPASKAAKLYLRNGFIKTNEISLENGEIVYRKQLL